VCALADEVGGQGRRGVCSMYQYLSKNFVQYTYFVILLIWVYKNQQPFKFRRHILHSLSALLLVVKTAKLDPTVHYTLMLIKTISAGKFYFLFKIENGAQETFLLKI
jgi:hypothetical protein